MVKKKKEAGLSPSFANIEFNLVDVSTRLREKRKVQLWLQQCVKAERKLPGLISYNFCSDAYLLKINKRFLNHDDFTDIITFDLCEGKMVSGDIYISVERVRENSAIHKSGFLNELHRVMVHGVLHLCGYKDKTPADKKLMRKKEDRCLSLLRKVST